MYEYNPEINKYEFTHSTNIENSQGSPIFLKGNIKVIAIQKNSENKADFIDSLEQTKKIIEDKTQSNEILIRDLDDVIAEMKKYYKQICFV